MTNKQVTRRIPADSELKVALRRLRDTPWLTIYCRLLVYGLRPHEAFLCTINPADGLCIIPSNTKTGERLVPPIPDLLPDLGVDLISLCQGPIPAVTAPQNRVYGVRTWEAFKRRDIPFNPYDLRHRWVVLSEEASIPPAIACSFAGHSVTTRYQVYTRTLDQRRAMSYALAKGYLQPTTNQTNLTNAN